MRPYLVSCAAGLVVGGLYALIRVQSPAPPIIALLGLLGMVAGEAAVTSLKSRMWPTSPVLAASATQDRSRP